MTKAQRRELDALREEVGLRDVGAEEAEEALFGDAAEVEEEARLEDARIDEVEASSFAGAEERGLSDQIPPGALQSGLALNAAVVLEEGADRDQARSRIARAIDAAALDLQIVGWQEAAGLVGQFITVIRLVLYVAITIIFLVALVIINNSMVIATMERVTEIGTLRAIGARRRLVLAMFLVETLALGALAGLLGAAIGGGLVAWWQQAGLPAPSRELMFLFGGPALYPELRLDHLAAGVVAILIVSALSAAYPAFLGASIQPVEAMRTEE
jgi:cell division protein FtsX